MRVSTGSWLRRIGWWTLMATCLVYATFGLTMAGLEIASWIFPGVDSKLRTLPTIFVVHAVSGSVALMSGPLQFHRSLRDRSLRVHRITGRAYVAAVWISSVTAACLTLVFDVPVAARIAFGSLAVLWFTTTTLGLHRVMNQRIAEHREWMLRSFALSLFFVTGSLWMEVSRSLSWAQAVTYPIAVFLGWTLNLVIAEIWIRSPRSTVWREDLHGVTGDPVQTDGLFARELHPRG